MKPVLFIASDHAGYKLKTILTEMLTAQGYTVTDCGADSFDPQDDYPGFIAKAAREVSKNPTAVKGIVIGGSGQGEALVANRFPGVRAALYYGGTLDIIKLSREHNDANVLSLGARFMTPEEAQTAVKLWLDTAFSGEERHVRRLAQIAEMEQVNSSAQ